MLLVICLKNWGDHEFLIGASIFTQLEFFVWVLLSNFYKRRIVIFLQMYSFLGLKVMGIFSCFLLLLFLSFPPWAVCNFYSSHSVFLFLYFNSIFFSISSIFFLMTWWKNSSSQLPPAVVAAAPHMFSDFRSGSPRGCPSGELYRCRKEQVFLFSEVCVVSTLPGV